MIIGIISGIALSKPLRVINEPRHDYSFEERFKLVALILLGVLFLVGFIVFFAARNPEK